MPNTPQNGKIVDEFAGMDVGVIICEHGLPVDAYCVKCQKEWEEITGNNREAPISP